MFEVRNDRRNLAQQVRERIYEMLQKDYFRAGDQIPTETELASRFGVSRTTAREALKLLEEERIIICKHGLGRFVASDSSALINEDIVRLQSVTEMAHRLGIAVDTQVLCVKKIPADDLVSARLRLRPGEEVYYVERTRKTKGEIIIYSIDIFPASLVPGPLPPEVFQGSLVSVLEENLGTRLLDYSRATISAVVLDQALCQKLGLDCGSAWVLMEQVNFNERDQPVLFSKDYHRGDHFQFHVLRRRR